MKNIISYFVLFYTWLDKLPCHIKTILILALIGLVGLSLTNHSIKEYLDSRFNALQKLLNQLEEYLEKVAPRINDILDNIIMYDSCASNVILLNYHNTLMSSNGLAYKKLTGICEKFRGFDNEPCIDNWGELDYINFVDEILKINLENYIYIDKDLNSLVKFPNLLYRLKKCGYLTAILYPVKGLGGPVGMVIVIYKNIGCAPTPTLEYYHEKMYPNLYKLSILLDFNNVKERYEN